MEYQVLIIDGRKFSDLKGFFDEVTMVLTEDQSAKKDFDGLHRLLAEVKDEIDDKAPVDLIWRHAELSKKRLGSETFTRILDVIQVHPNVNLLLD